MSESIDKNEESVQTVTNSPGRDSNLADESNIAK